MRLEMETYKVEATVEEDGSISIKGLPLQAGEKVKVAISRLKQKVIKDSKHPLWGKPFQLIDPFRPVAEDDWQVLRDAR